MKGNRARIRKKIRNVYILRGCLIGLIVCTVITAAGIFVGLMYAVRYPEITLEFVLITAVCGLIGFVLSLFKSRKVLKQADVQEREYGGIPFDTDQLRMCCESSTVYAGADWLVWHQDMKTEIWHRGSLADLSVTTEGEGKKYGLLKVDEKNGKSSRVLFARSEEDLNAELKAWLFPFVEEPVSVCPVCGSEIEPGTQFCGNCGADLR